MGVHVVILGPKTIYLKQLTGNIIIIRIKFMHYILLRNPYELIYKLFKCQWYLPTKGDLTEQLKIYLSDLDIPTDFNYLNKPDKAKLSSTHFRLLISSLFLC